MLRSPVVRTAFALCLCLGAWRWVRQVLIPSDTAHAIATQRPIGNNSDLYPRWIGTRELLLNHKDPYSAEVTREIQVGYYGRALDAAKSEDPQDQAGFAYPIYIAFFLWPTTQMRFSTLQWTAGWIMLAATALSVPLWQHAFGLRLGGETQLITVLLLFASYSVVQGYLLQQITLIVAFLLAAGCAAIASERLVLGGVLLAVSTIKPQLALPLLVVTGIWCIGNWRARWRLFAGFFLAMAFLIGGGLLVYPAWISRFVSAIRQYQAYAGDVPLLLVLLGGSLGMVVAAFLGAGLLIVTWIIRHDAFTSPRIAMVIAGMLAFDLLAIPKLAPYNQVLLLPSALLLWSHRDQLLRSRFLVRVFWRAAVTCLAWQWFAATALALMSLVRSSAIPANLAGTPLYSVYAIPPTIFLAIAALAVRQLKLS